MNSTLAILDTYSSLDPGSDWTVYTTYYVVHVTTFLPTTNKIHPVFTSPDGESVIYIPGKVIGNCKKDRVQNCIQDIITYDFSYLKTGAIFTIQASDLYTVCDVRDMMLASEDWVWIDLYPIIRASFDELLEPLDYRTMM